MRKKTDAAKDELQARRKSRSGRAAKKSGKNAKPAKKVKRKRPMSRKLKSKLNLLYGIGIMVVLTILMISRYATISELEYKISDIDSKIEELQSEKHDLGIEIEEIKDSDWLKDQAEERINMRTADIDQIVELDLDGSDEGNESGIMGFFKNLFNLN